MATKKLGTWDFLKMAGKNVLQGDAMKTVDDLKEAIEQSEEKPEDATVIDTEAEDVE